MPGPEAGDPWLSLGGSLGSFEVSLCTRQRGESVVKRSVVKGSVRERCLIKHSPPPPPAAARSALPLAWLETLKQEAKPSFSLSSPQESQNVIHLS